MPSIRARPWRHCSFVVCAMFCGLTVIGGATATVQKSDGPATQNPSPMVEHTRGHPRLKQESPDGVRERLELGTFFRPAQLTGATTPLFVHFHGGSWIPEVAASRRNQAVIHLQLGSGSAAYAKPFHDRTLFTRLLDEAQRKSGLQFQSVVLTAWSAGYGAVREILQSPENYQRVHGVILIDGLHTGYVGGKPGPVESQLETDKLEIFARFARDAAAARKRMLITHSEIFPGTFASTTETADYLIRELGLKRTAVLKWGPMQTQQLSETRSGNLVVLGFAGNSAPDHVDQLHALPDFLAQFDLAQDSDK